MVELTKLAGSVVGEAGGDCGLSREQRKRLSIAVELVANPSVVFMVRGQQGLKGMQACLGQGLAKGKLTFCSLSSGMVQLPHHPLTAS